MTNYLEVAAIIYKQHREEYENIFFGAAFLIELYFADRFFEKIRPL